ncbi:uncharacterized protein LOC121729932 [Aricia agestis]|uniref:uncharacterized protein LOC121729932 n=1 Tax=Aricia agestis TaxID=91739 RepID=UPI001C2087C2|nr:uncharacterized protein LOC121729932 [Aricia agestis]
MDNSNSENEVQKPLRSPPRRRRSTFFERRDSLVPPPLSENIDPNVCNKIRSMDEKQDHQLQAYCDKLLAEKEQWKKEVNNRRNVYHDLRHQYQMAVKAPSRSRITYSVLSDEDIEFVKAKVNISKLIDSQQKLHESIRETQQLYRRANALDDVLLNYCEDKVKKITNYILENSTVDPKE